MKFNCGEDPVKKRLKREQRKADKFNAWLLWYENWHPKFAWWPIRLGDNDCRWLEYVEEKATYVRYDVFNYWRKEYRALK